VFVEGDFGVTVKMMPPGLHFFLVGTEGIQ